MSSEHEEWCSKCETYDINEKVMLSEIEILELMIITLKGKTDRLVSKNKSLDSEVKTANLAFKESQREK